MFIIWSALRANNVIIGKLSLLYYLYQNVFSCTELTPQDVKFGEEHILCLLFVIQV